MLALGDIEAAAKRIKPLINRTSVVSSSRLNEYLGHSLFFKAECMQKVGAFKARGASNALAWLKEQGKLPKKVVAFSSGNHAQAVAWAASRFGMQSEIFMPENVSKVKKQATESYGAKVVLCKTRQEAEEKARIAAEKGAVLIPPYDNDQIICGQGTACLEALSQVRDIDAVFAPCGGGGLLSGTLIAAKGISKSIKVFGGEPAIANDAAKSIRANKIFKWKSMPMTIADGARTLAVSERTLQYLKKLDGFYEISEEEIKYWTQWMCHLLKLHCEPTSALGLAAAYHWLKGQKARKNVLIIISGGNMDKKTVDEVWDRDYLIIEPGKFNPSA